MCTKYSREHIFPNSDSDYAKIIISPFNVTATITRSIFIKDYINSHSLKKYIENLVSMDFKIKFLCHTYLIISIISSSDSAITPKILSCIAGFQKCIGVPDIQSAKVVMKGLADLSFSAESESEVNNMMEC